ncbi:MAG: hypothetical protein AB2A00_13840 [Myxococcota bacterium]
MAAMTEWHGKAGGRGEACGPTGCAVASYGDVAAEREAGRTGALAVDRSRCARLQLTGKDRRDLVQRLTTNDVLNVPDGMGVATVFTTGKGRIVDRVVLHAASDGDLLVGSADRADPLIEWMNGYIMREDVTVTNLTPATTQIDVVGPKAVEVTGATLLTSAALHELMVVELAGMQVLAARADPVGGQTVRLIVPEGLGPRLMDALVAKGARPGGGDAYNALRLEAGLPLYGPEMNLEHSPLEAGLVDTLHFAKGCYIGQEVVARIDTYMKQRRYLIAVEVEGPPPAAGATLSLSNGDSGAVTSSADVGNGKSRLLGYIKTEDPRVGMLVDVIEGDVRRQGVVRNRPAQAPAPKGGEGSQCSVVI